MSLRPWKLIHDETLVHYKVFRVLRSTRQSPRNEHEVGFFLIDTWDWVNVVAITEHDELILVRQYRQGTDEATLEIPGGLVHNDGEGAEFAARRELREESGYVAADWHYLGTSRPNPAIFTNSMATYLATGCRLEGELQQDDGEDLEVVLMPLSEVEDRVRAGDIDHSLVLAGLYYYSLHR